MIQDLGTAVSATGAAARGAAGTCRGTAGRPKVTGPQLATGGINATPHFPAHGNLNSGLGQGIGKPANGAFFRRSEGTVTAL